MSSWKNDNGEDEIFPAAWFADAVNGLRLPPPDNPGDGKSEPQTTPTDDQEQQ